MSSPKEDLLALIRQLESLQKSFSYGFRDNPYTADDDQICSFCSKNRSEQSHDEDCQWAALNTKLQELNTKYRQDLDPQWWHRSGCDCGCPSEEYHWTLWNRERRDTR